MLLLGNTQKKSIWGTSHPRYQTCPLYPGLHPLHNCPHNITQLLHHFCKAGKHCSHHKIPQLQELVTTESVLWMKQTSVITKTITFKTANYCVIFANMHWQTNADNNLYLAGVVPQITHTFKIHLFALTRTVLWHLLNIPTFKRPFLHSQTSHYLVQNVPSGSLQEPWKLMIQWMLNNFPHRLALQLKILRIYNTMPTHYCQP